VVQIGGEGKTELTEAELDALEQPAAPETGAAPGTDGGTMLGRRGLLEALGAMLAGLLARIPDLV